MNFITKERNERIVDAIALIVLGALMVIFNQATLSVFTLVSGISCLVFGTLFLIAYFSTFLIHDASLLLRGALYLLLGSLILSFPDSYIYFMVFAISIYLIYAGIEEIAYSIDLAKLKVRNWWIDLLDAVLDFAFGVTILVLQFANGSGSAIVCIVSGASLIVYGALELVLIFSLHRDFKKASKVVSEQ